MACKTSFDLHHNFPKLAEETGFAFNTHRPRVHIDWNKIRLIDIENLARDRKFAVIEQHINDVLDCILESEFDVRILDEGVVKMFRLAQLTIEYQQFCRHYLDRSVFVLRQEIDSVTQELSFVKKDLQEKEEELRKSRKKGKQNHRTILPYGNDNIATMILKTLTNKSDIFPSATNGEVTQYNKCMYCDKVFLNQLYLKGHISRRHMNMFHDFPEKDTLEKNQNANTSFNDNNKLNDEIKELKSKLQEMEVLITSNPSNSIVPENNIKRTKSDDEKTAKNTRDVEVSTADNDMFEKLEEWKKEEQEKHSKEIHLLKNQILETLNSFKQNDDQKTEQNDTNIMDQLHMRIKEQGAEILALKQALSQCKESSQHEETVRKKEIEAQMTYWAQRDEAQSKQYDLLVQKLNEVAKAAKESQASAESERERAKLLEERLNETLHKKITTVDSSSDVDVVSDNPVNGIDSQKVQMKPKPIVDHKSLEQLHRKAQKLLSMKSSSSSDISSEEHSKKILHPKLSNNVSNRYFINKNTKSLQSADNVVSSNMKKSSAKSHKSKASKSKERKNTESSKPTSDFMAKQMNGPILPPGSPLKVVRAKLTEEVNSRLVSAGVDPLKSKLPKSVFQKQRAQLQQQQEFKCKKYPAHEKIRYTIMAYIDANVSEAKGTRKSTQSNDVTNSNAKSFSLTSMMSNVKSKALSFVKTKDTKRRNEYKSLNSEVAKRALSLLKTPPGSPTDSAVPPRSSPKSRPIILENISSAQQNKDSSSTIKENNNKEFLINRKNLSPTPDYDSKSESDGSERKYKTDIPQRPSRSVDNLIKSPARRPSSVNTNYNTTIVKHELINKGNMFHAQSASNLSKHPTIQIENDDDITNHTDSDKGNIKSLLSTGIKYMSEENIQDSQRQTKGVLKNASSTSSLNKKKVIFDMDAIQMKSVSASPSQSVTEKTDENYEFGLMNLGDEEWDISSIENEPIKSDTKLKTRTRPSTKIAELKQTIESQLARRSETPSTALFGVDVLRGPVTKAASIGGSNTSLGSSILDDSDSAKAIDQKTFVKPRKIAEKEDSELDVSDFSVDGLTNKRERDNF